MFVVNLAFIRSSNGMFWFAIDKIKSLGGEQSSCLVLVHDTLIPLIQREIPLVRVEGASRLAAWKKIVALKRRNGASMRTVTFTSHPIPFLRKQTIAFYDDYPFEGWSGLIKRMLFVVAASTSRSRIGIINRSRAIPFLQNKCRIPAERIFFDSAFPTVDITGLPARLAVPRTPLHIGLVGTDSFKKDYASVFSAVKDLGVEQDVCFVIYGAENDYTNELQRDFPDINQTILASDTVQMPAFFAAIDYLASAATAEGYGRPMGLAATLGVPMFLLRSPVFLEFFSNHALFFDNIGAMIRYLVVERPAASISIQPNIAATQTRSPFFE